jgi:hypothetical protein
VFGKESKKKELVNNLGEIYQKIEREHQISPGDFPSLRKMQVRPPWVLAESSMWISGPWGVRKTPGTRTVVLEGIPALRGVGASQTETAG